MIVMCVKKEQAHSTSRLSHPPRSHFVLSIFLVFSPSAHPLINYLAFVFWHCLHWEGNGLRERVRAAWLVKDLKNRC